MPTPLPAAGAASGSDAWQELEDVLASLGQLARSPIEPESFYERTLVECVRALSATGGAAWLRTDTGALRPAARLNWPGETIESDTTARRAHEAVLTGAANAGHVVTSAAGTLIAPVQIADDEAHQSGERATVAIFEISPRADASPTAHRGYEQFLAAVCEVAGEYHTSREFARLRGEENYRAQLVRLGTLVHRSIELTPTAYAIANEGRRVLGCDRLSVLRADGRHVRLLATSGASHVERRSGAVRGMERLAELVGPTAEPALYTDGQSDALPPITDALEAHAEESHARHIAVLPLSTSTDGDIGPATGARSQRRAKPAFILVAEQFDARNGALDKQRLMDVGELCATALYNALEVDQLPLRWLLAPLARAKRQVVEHVARSTAIAGAILAAIAALVILPADFTIEAPGTLEPAIRREVFAPRSGLVDEVLVEQGADVTAGQPLLKLRDPQLELDLQRVQGEMETVRRQLEAARATKSSREVRDESAVELYRISANEREFEQQLANLRSELKLLEQQRANLVVRSPIAGRVLTWDLAGRLTARPVERGESLLSVGDLSADWQVELAVVDDRIGHVLSAQSDSDDGALPVRFRLRSADAAHTGHIERIGMAASVDTRDTTSPQPTVEVVVAFDKSQLDEAEQRELRPGISARAEIDCGRRSLGYVWLHDLWDAAITWLRF